MNNRTENLSPVDKELLELSNYCRCSACTHSLFKTLVTWTLPPCPCCVGCIKYAVKHTDVIIFEEDIIIKKTRAYMEKCKQIHKIVETNDLL